MIQLDHFPGILLIDSNGVEDCGGFQESSEQLQLVPKLFSSHFPSQRAAPSLTALYELDAHNSKKFSHKLETPGFYTKYKLEVNKSK